MWYGMGELSPMPWARALRGDASPTYQSNKRSDHEETAPGYSVGTRRGKLGARRDSSEERRYLPALLDLRYIIMTSFRPGPEDAEYG